MISPPGRQPRGGAGLRRGDSARVPDPPPGWRGSLGPLRGQPGPDAGRHRGGVPGSIADITSRKVGELALEKAYREIAELKDRLEAENTYYREKIQSVEGSGELLGQSDPMKYLHFRIRQVAPSDTTVLILGETGTGKELVADAIHALGPRKDRPLIKVNCAALPPALAESELFGHEKGAFTGSTSQRKGRFELADGATLFLDEVGELPSELQAKLLRVLQDGTFERVGGDRTLKADVRMIAATNRNLVQDVKAGRFREDCGTGSTSFPSACLPSASARRTSPPWPWRSSTAPASGCPSRPWRSRAR